MTTKILFKLPAEYVVHATGGILLGEFNNWDPAHAVELRKHEDGSMYAEIALAVGKTYEYRYLLNDGRWVNGNSSVTWTEVFGNIVENCIVDVPVPAVKKKSAGVVKTARPTIAKGKTLAEDLTRIKGISKKSALILKKAGLLTYKDLSKSTIKNIKAVMEAAGTRLPVSNITSWPKQAKLAAAGKWEELESFQSTLATGK